MLVLFVRTHREPTWIHFLCSCTFVICYRASYYFRLTWNRN